MYLQIEFLNIQDALKLNKNETFKTNIFIEKLHSNRMHVIIVPFILIFKNI